MATLERAIAIAAEAHAGQVDKAGAPYILHPLRIMMKMEAEEDRIVAVLHDVLEDCPDWTAAKLIANGFSTAVICALVTLTRGREETYGAFIERCGENPLARRVKLADLFDNSRIERIPSPTEADWARLKKYGKAATRLLALTGPDRP